MRKTIVLLLSLMLAFAAASCSVTTQSTSDEGGDSGYQRGTGVTGSGYEYIASVDQDNLTCFVEYEGASVEINEDD